MGYPASDYSTELALNEHQNQLLMRAHTYENKPAASVIIPRSLSLKEQQSQMLWLLNNTKKASESHNDAKNHTRERYASMENNGKLSFNNKILLTFSIFIFSFFSWLFASVAATSTKVLILEDSFKLAVDAQTVLLWVLFALSFLSVLVSIWVLVLSFIQQSESEDFPSADAS